MKKDYILKKNIFIQRSSISISIIEQELLEFAQKEGLIYENGMPTQKSID